MQNTSYEIIIDELRDYRFYKNQIHPSNEAVEYVLNKFMNCFLSEDQLNYIKSFKSKQDFLFSYASDTIQSKKHKLKVLLDLDKLSNCSTINWK